MSLRIADFKGEYEAKNISEFESVLKKRYGSDVNEFWISHGDESNPVIALLVKGDLSCVHYFPFEGHPGFVSVGKAEGLDRDGFTTFSLQTVEQEQDIWNRQVISTSDAMSAVRDFFNSRELPTSIEWEEL